MIAYLVSPTYEAGAAMAGRLGWTQIAANRFVTRGRNDMRLVTRMSDLVAAPGVTVMMRVPEYATGPAAGVEQLAWIGRDRGAGQRDEFDLFVASGRGRWVDDVDAVAEGMANVQGSGEVSRVGPATAVVF